MRYVLVIFRKKYQKITTEILKKCISKISKINGGRNCHRRKCYFGNISFYVIERRFAKSYILIRMWIGNTIFRHTNYGDYYIRSTKKTTRKGYHKAQLYQIRQLPLNSTTIPANCQKKPFIEISFLFKISVCMWYKWDWRNHNIHPSHLS